MANIKKFFATRKFGKSHKGSFFNECILGCPFYASRIITENAEIIFCPYNYLLHPSNYHFRILGIRKSLNIKLENNIVILDEGKFLFYLLAHNIEDTCRSSASMELTTQGLERNKNNTKFRGV